MKTLSGHTDLVLSISFSSNENYVASSSKDNTIKIWDIKTGILIHNLLGHYWEVLSISFSLDG